MLNTLVVLYVISFSNMGVAIILFTLLVRLVTLPLTVRQVKQMRAMSGLQPTLRGIQQRYARDRSRISRETMAAYKEAGVSPIVYRALSNPDAYLVWVIQGADSNVVQQTRRFSRSFRETLLMARILPDLSSCSA